MKKYVLCFILALLSGGAFQVSAQDTISSAHSEIVSKEDTTHTFPQWARDLRRADIITFGAFPFAWLITSIFIDVDRYIRHDNDSQYAPWPLKDENSIAWAKDDYIRCLWISATVAVSVALVDFIIVQVKRSIAKKKAQAFIPDNFEVKRTPLNALPAETAPPDAQKEAAKEAR